MTRPESRTRQSGRGSGKVPLEQGPSKVWSVERNQGLTDQRAERSRPQELPKGTDGVRTEIWLVDIDSTRVTFTVEAQPGTTAAELAEAHAILESIRSEPTDGARIRRRSRSRRAGIPARGWLHKIAG